jgi:hypothetical protein
MKKMKIAVTSMVILSGGLALWNAYTGEYKAVAPWVSSMLGWALFCYVYGLYKECSEQHISTLYAKFNDKIKYKLLLKEHNKLKNPPRDSKGRFKKRG